MKHIVKKLLFLLLFFYCFFTPLQNVQAVEYQTPVTIELVKALEPNNFPTKGEIDSTLVQSKAEKKYPQTGETANYWSIIGLGIILLILCLYIKNKFRKGDQK